MVLVRALHDAHQEMRDLLPTGRAWPKGPRANLNLLLSGLSASRAALEVRSEDLIEESDPRTTSEMLEDWERVLGLPDACLPEPQSLAERRALITSRLVGLGGATPDHFIALASQAGYEVTITEGVGAPAKAGQAAAGDPCGPGLQSLVWTVTSASTTVRTAKAGQAKAGDPIATWGNDLLECVIERASPAHTLVLFAYLVGCRILILDELGNAIELQVVGDDLIVLDEHGAMVVIPGAAGAMSITDENGDPVGVAINCN